MTNLIGKSLGRYHILEQLGEGGMAIVYKAYDTRLETDVAVKVIRTENILPSVLERALKRFEREAKSLAKLTHPNIVKVMDYGDYEGKPYLVLPYLPGGTLKQKLGKPIGWQEAVEMLLPIAEAMDYAHSQKMVHRDVKPANILLTERGQPMLTDFGIAKVLDIEETMDLTGTSAAVGTPEYMAPEQATAKIADHRADIYALGIVLYEMITGRKPYTADTPMAVLIMHARDPLPRPSKFVSGIPDAVEKVLIKTLAKSPDGRYQSMKDFAVALAELTTGSPPKKKAEPVLPPKKEKPIIQKKTRKQIPPTHKKIKVSPKMAFTLIGGFALLIIAILWLPPLMDSVGNSSLPTVSVTKMRLPTDTPTQIISPAATFTPTLILTPTPSAPFSYIILEGESLNSVSEKFGLGENGILLLLALNPVVEARGFVFVGEEVLVPSPGMELPTPTLVPPDLPRGTPLNYTVRPGDSLAAIAVKFRSTEDAIIDENKLENANSIQVGQILAIPVNLVTPEPTRLPPTALADVVVTATPTIVTNGGNVGGGTCEYQENTDFIAQIFELVNNERVTQGLSPLAENPQLTAAALVHASDMACNSFFQEIGSNGSTLEERIATQGYTASLAVQEIHAQPPEYGGDGQAAFDAWVGGATLLNPNATEIGIAYAYSQDSALGGYFTAILATP